MVLKKPLPCGARVQLQPGRPYQNFTVTVPLESAVKKGNEVAIEEGAARLKPAWGGQETLTKSHESEQSRALLRTTR